MLCATQKKCCRQHFFILRGRQTFEFWMKMPFTVVLPFVHPYPTRHKFPLCAAPRGRLGFFIILWRPQQLGLDVLADALTSRRWSAEVEEPSSTYLTAISTIEVTLASTHCALVVRNTAPILRCSLTSLLFEVRCICKFQDCVTEWA